MSPSESRAPSWVVPLTAVVLGLAFLTIGLATGHARTGVTSMIVMVVYAAGLVVMRRRDSEVGALLTGDLADERRVGIQQNANAVTGRVLIVVVVAGLLWSLAAQNHYVGVFSALCVVGGVTQFTATAWGSRRS